MSEEFVPLRELIESRFDGIEARLTRIENGLDGGHKHKEFPTWLGLIPILLALAGLDLVF